MGSGRFARVMGAPHELQRSLVYSHFGGRTLFGFTHWSPPGHVRLHPPDRYGSRPVGLLRRVVADGTGMRGTEVEGFGGGAVGAEVADLLFSYFDGGHVSFGDEPESVDRLAGGLQPLLFSPHYVGMPRAFRGRAKQSC